MRIWGLVFGVPRGGAVWYVCCKKEIPGHKEKKNIYRLRDKPKKEGKCRAVMIPLVPLIGSSTAGQLLYLDVVAGRKNTTGCNFTCKAMVKPEWALL